MRGIADAIEILGWLILSGCAVIALGLIAAKYR